MSQSKQRGSGNRSTPSSSKSSVPNKAGARPSSTKPDVVRQPINQRGTQPPGRRVDRALPPFSARRYIVIWLGFLALLLVVLLVLLQFNNKSPAASGSPSASSKSKYMVIETPKGKIVAKLHTEPEAGVSKTIANFEQKANSGYFNGLAFHRVENWVIQGGDPKGDGTGGGTMPSEYNKLPFKAGALGVARGGDSALNNDSQFFFVKSDADYLDGQYTNFGQLTEGMDVVNKIAIGDKITKVTVEER